MYNFLRGTRRLFLFRQKSILTSALIVGATIVLSRFFGFLRYRVLAGYFDKAQLDLYFASFRIPDLVFEILITGALTSAFIPIFIKYQKDKDRLNINVSSIINIISLVFLGFIIIFSLFANALIPLATPGFTQEQVRQVVYFSRILLISQLPFMVLASFLTAIGQANKIFILSAVAPVGYNLAIIAATMAFAPKIGLMAPVLGVSAGAAILFIVQLPLIFSSGFIYKPFIKITTGIKEFFTLIVPRVITVITSQIDATIDLMLATILGTGAYTVFYFAQHLQLLPVSIIGISIGQASLPYLSEVYQDKKINEFKRIISETILSIFFLTIPIMAFFVFARTPLVRLFFGGEKFDWPATVQTAITLSYFSLSIPLHSIYYFVTRCFYAFLDSKTPFYISVGSIIFNIVLSLLFIFYFKLPVWALGISFSLSIFLNVSLLLYILEKKVQGFNKGFIFLESIKILAATFISAFFSYAIMKVLDGLVLDTTRTINVFLLLVIAGVTYLSLYVFLSWIFKVQEVHNLVKLLSKAKEYRRKIIEIYTGIES